MSPPCFPVEPNGAEDTLSAPDGWCCTEMKITSFTYTWTIKNFSFFEQKCGEKVESAIFPSGCREDIKWCMDIYPNGRDENSEDFTAVFLRLHDCRNNEVDAKYRFSILDFEGKKRDSHYSNHPDRFTLGKSWGWKKFVSREDLFRPTNGLLPDDSLTILCEVSVSEGKSVTVSGQNTASVVNVPNCQISQDYDRLFQSGHFGDVVFKLGDHELHAHKTVLVARCPVFASMFEHDMAEKMQNKVDVTDIDHEVFREMLRFIYTGQAPNIDKFPMDLLVASDKYALERLKAMCEKAVSSHLSEENAAEVLVFADMHSANQLKTQALRYIGSHALAVKRTAGWRNMISSNPALALDVSTELFTRAMSPVGPLAKRMKFE